MKYLKYQKALPVMRLAVFYYYAYTFKTIIPKELGDIRIKKSELESSDQVI